MSEVPEIDKTVVGEVIETQTVDIDPAPEVSPAEQAALEREQSALDVAILKAQVEHLTARVIELARENARLKEECTSE